jgi:hypothetical protein
MYPKYSINECFEYLCEKRELFLIFHKHLKSKQIKLKTFELLIKNQMN